VKLIPAPAVSAPFIGTSLLWFTHFAALYALAEIACNTPRLNAAALGIPLWQWASVGLTFVLAAAVAWLGLRGAQLALRPQQATDPDRPFATSPDVQARTAFMGRVGACLAALYLLVMLYSLILTLGVPVCR